MKGLIEYVSGLPLTVEQKFKILELSKDETPYLLTVEQAAKLIGISPRRLRVLIDRRDFPKVINGNKKLIIRHEIQKWLENNINQIF